MYLILKRKKANAIFVDVLHKVLYKNHDEYPARLDQFADAIADELWERLRLIDDSPAMFERLDQSTCEADVQNDSGLC